LPRRPRRDQAAMESRQASRTSLAPTELDGGLRVWSATSSGFEVESAENSSSHRTRATDRRNLASKIWTIDRLRELPCAIKGAPIRRAIAV
jgi:hypothetical protein